ncbi:MAG: hypothetical protein EHM13_14300, partial [Acidobacteria bacterium]
MHHRTLVVLLSVFAAAPGSAAAQLAGRVLVSGLAQPVALVQDPSDPAVQFVVERGGRIRVVRSGVLLSSDFLDLTAAVSLGGERGLLGLAFPPDHATTLRFYVNFTNTAGDTVVARFRRTAPGALSADAASRFDLRWGGPGGAAFISQPFANHNGGNLAFGPDGYLYIGLGDGGSANDPGDRAQDPNTLLGKMLRIDVNVPDSDPQGYRIPADNPFVGVAPVAALPEIWAFGLRNPWRYSFDAPALGGTGALLLTDVGQSSWEEIDYEPAGRGGRNYGWRVREGAHPNPNIPPSNAAYLPLTDPIFEYGRESGGAVTGGYVYRGTHLGSAFAGRYFFGDFVSGRVWSLALAAACSGEATAGDLREHTAELGGASVLGNIS